jgi:hypothetical protein
MENLTDERIHKKAFQIATEVWLNARNNGYVSSDRKVLTTSMEMHIRELMTGVASKEPTPCIYCENMVRWL